MWSTRSSRWSPLGAGLLAVLAGMVVVQAQESADATETPGPKIVLEIRGLHYDAGDPVTVRLTSRNEGTDTITSPLTSPLLGGFRLTDADGKTHRPEKLGKDHPDQRPARLAPEAFFGTVVDLTEHFPVLSNIGRYSLNYVAGDTVSNEVVLNVIDAFKPQSSFAAMIETSQGSVKLDLYTDVAPITVRNFVDLSRQGFYDGLTFHYMRPGDLLIGGDPRGDGSGGSGFSLPAEMNDRKHLTGTIGMVRAADRNSASSQFYICLAPRPERDGQFTVFAQVVDGFDTLEKIAAVPTSGRDERPYFRPIEPLVIESITIIETEPESDLAT